MNVNSTGRRVWLSAAFCVLMLLGGRGIGAVQMKVVTVQRGDFSEIQERREAVIRTAAEWTALWKQHRPGEKPPPVDFKGFMVAGVFMGSRPTGGYTIEVTAVEREGPDFVVVYRERAPDPKDMVTQMLTSPFHLIRVDRHAGPVRFRPAPGG